MIVVVKSDGIDKWVSDMRSAFVYRLPKINYLYRTNSTDAIRL